MIRWLKSFFAYEPIKIGDIYYHGEAWFLPCVEKEIEIFNISSSGKHVDVGGLEIPSRFIYHYCTYIRNIRERNEDANK